MSDDFAVVKAHPRFLEYVDALQRKNAEALAFYPRQVFERDLAAGRLFLGLLNGQPCGYLYVGSGRDGILRCHQVCIEYDARRRLYGAAIVTVAEAHGLEQGVAEVSLRCGADLDANDFWRSLGYTCIGTEPGGLLGEA